MALKIGTTGYTHLFPELPPSARFRRYAEFFSTVELPSTHHRIPTKDQVRRWRNKAPPGFVYSFLAPRYLSYQPGGEERRTLRKFLRRHRLLGPARGGVRFLLPKTLDPAAFEAWLSMLAEIAIAGDYAFEGPEPLEALALEAGHAAVRLQRGPFYYLHNPKALPEGRGYAYFDRLADALYHSRRAQGGTQTNQTR